MEPVQYATEIVEALREPLLVLSGDLVVEVTNPAFLRHFSLPEEAVLGRSVFELADGDFDVPALRTLLLEVIREHTSFQDFEVSYEGAEGHRTVLINARQLTHQGRGRSRILLVFEDVTERYARDRALQRHSRDLARSNRELEEFAHAAAHDLQEPLRKIHMFLDRFVSRLPEEVLDEAGRTDLGRVRDATHRLQRRIDDLLSLARASRTVPRPEPVDLESTVRAALRDVQGSRPMDEEVQVEIGPLPVIEADPGQMQRLLQNLFSNAFKYRHEARPLRVRVEASRLAGEDDRDWIRLRVEDNGIGFDPEYSERIFGAFQRLHGRAEYEGSGVGLSICRAIAEQHGGSIRATGRPGEGARFDIVLPTVQPELEEDR